MGNVFKSWKTTLAGLALFFQTAGNEVIALIDGDPSTIPSITVIFAAGLVLFGLGAARDGDVSSEDVGANK